MDEIITPIVDEVVDAVADVAIEEPSSIETPTEEVPEA